MPGRRSRSRQGLVAWVQFGESDRAATHTLFHLAYSHGD